MTDRDPPGMSVRYFAQGAVRSYDQVDQAMYPVVSEVRQRVTDALPDELRAAICLGYNIPPLILHHVIRHQTSDPDKLAHAWQVEYESGRVLATLPFEALGVAPWCTADRESRWCQLLGFYYRRSWKA